jgi:putative membrane protein
MSFEHRLHPYTILFAFLAQVRLFIVPGIFIYFGIGSGDREWWQPWMMLFVVPAAGLSMLRYFTYRFRYETSELVIRTGLVFRKERHIPYARIQNIDAVQNVLHRFLNVVEIKIETGGGQSAEATMSVLPFAALEEMRGRVFAERHAVALPEPTSEQQSQPLLELDLRELLLCGFIENRGAVLIAAGSGVMWELGIFDRLFGLLFGEVSVGRGTIRNLLRGILPAVTVSWLSVALTMVAIVGVVLLIRSFSMAWAVVRLYGFRLTLVDNDARSQFGLLTRVAMTIPLRRVQTLIIRESPLHRAFSRVAVKAGTAGGGHEEQNNQSEREYLAPILRRDALDHFTRAIVGVTVSGITWQQAHPGAFRREVKGWLVPAVLVSAGAAFYLRWLAAAVVPILLIWAIIGARQTVRHLGWALADDAVLFRSGWLWRRIVVVRFAKMQTITRHESPFDRRTQMARVHVDTAAAAAGAVIDIPYVARDDAEALFTRLSREAAERQFKW